jgi:hypothetical protein
MGKIAALGIVKSMAVSQVSHMLQEIIDKRPPFQPWIIYTDTWPFWTTPDIGRLGLFHLMKEILDTLNPSVLSAGKRWSNSSLPFTDTMMRICA